MNGATGFRLLKCCPLAKLWLWGKKMKILVPLMTSEKSCSKLCVTKIMI